MKALKFYDLGEKKAFMSSDYKIVKRKNGKRTIPFAVTVHKGRESWRILPQDYHDTVYGKKSPSKRSPKSKSKKSPSKRSKKPKRKSPSKRSR